MNDLPPHDDRNLDSSDSPTSRSGLSLIPKPVWWIGALILVVLLAAVPLKLHPIDTWIHGLFGHTPEGEVSNAADHDHQLWTCSMHPQVIEDHPGQCPICGMNLVPLKGAGDGATPTASQGDSGSSESSADGTGSGRKILFYRNPMDPSITSPEPRKDDMGMDYVPVYADEAAAVTAGGPVVTIDPVVQQNMNVTTETVTRRDVSRQIRTVGYLDYDQEKMVSVTTKYPGFVEKVSVNYLGQPVQKGEHLFDVYAPELVQTEQELLSAARYVEQLKDAPEDAVRRAQALLDAGRTRLSYWDITDDQVDRMLASGKIFRTLSVVAPASGVVMMRMDGLEGMAIRPGMELMHIADMSTLWLTVEVFDDQLAWVDIGSSADVKLSYFPGEGFTGRVRYIEPAVSEETRTIQLTLEVPNPRGRLRSGMYATVTFSPVAARDAIAVPSDAIIRTGERNVVILALGDGRFAPSDVVLGPSGEGWAQVLSGVSEGDEVVTSAQFLIDSESNLREAIQTMVEAKRQEAKGSAR